MATLVIHYNCSGVVNALIVVCISAICKLIDNTTIEVISDEVA